MILVQFTPVNNHYISKNIIGMKKKIVPKNEEKDNQRLGCL